MFAKFQVAVERQFAFGSTTSTALRASTTDTDTKHLPYSTAVHVC